MIAIQCPFCAAPSDDVTPLNMPRGTMKEVWRRVLCLKCHGAFDIVYEVAGMRPPPPVDTTEPPLRKIRAIHQETLTATVDAPSSGEGQEAH